MNRVRRLNGHLAKRPSGFQQGNKYWQLAEESRKNRNPRYITVMLQNELDKKFKGEKSYLQAMITNIAKRAALGDPIAQSFVADRIEGKPVQAHSVSGSIQNEHKHVHITMSVEEAADIYADQLKLITNKE